MRWMLAVVVPFVVALVAPGVRAGEEIGVTRSPGFHFVEVQGARGAVKGVIYVPWGLDTSEGAPAIVFLHGYGECGTEGTHQLGVGLPNALIWNPERWPFVVVIPQKPVFNAEWDNYEDAVLKMLDLAIADYGVDADRVALTGLSQGGHGTIALASHHPERFRAAAPVCGYTRGHFDAEGVRRELSPVSAQTAEVVQAAEQLKGMPVWIFHGGKDDVVPPAESQSVHDALEAAGAGEVKLTIFPEDNHNSWDSAYRKSGLWEWLAEQTEAR
ncbi:MAG: prolyl oligopeptidase family serine peptidase [Phycisphaerales bacterium]